MRRPRNPHLLLAIAVVVSAIGFLSWLFGLRVWLYAASVALLLFIVYALKYMPRPHRRPGVGQFEQEPSRREAVAKVRRNDPCPCGSGEKYKRCCGTG